MSHIISYNSSDMKQIGNQFQIRKKTRNETISKMNDIIKKETAHEQKQLEKAIENYEKKLEQVMESSHVIKYKHEIENTTEEMKKYVKEASQFFVSEKEKIRKNKNLSSKEKQTKEKELFEFISSQFITEEERKNFENLIHANGIVVLGCSNNMFF